MNRNYALKKQSNMIKLLHQLSPYTNRSLKPVRESNRPGYYFRYTRRNKTVRTDHPLIKYRPHGYQPPIYLI